MVNIDELKEKRFRFLQRVYELTGGSEVKDFSFYEIGEELQLDRELTELIIQYLVNEGLIKYSAMGKITICHNGVIEVEEALASPDKPTEHFPPANVINIGKMVNSQIQQASPGSIQKVKLIENNVQLIKFINELKKSIDQLGLSDEQNTDLHAEIKTIEAQQQSTKPNNIILAESFSSIRRILEGAAGSILASTLLAKIAALISG